MSYRIGRRSILWQLLGLPVAFRGSVSAEQLTPPRNLRIVGDQGAGNPNPTSPVARGVYPRLFLTPERAATLRKQLRSESALRSRWQTAVNQFESGKWNDSGTAEDSYNRSFAAFLALVRRPNDDLGLSWRDSWQTYRNRVVTDALTWKVGGREGYKPHEIGLALVYDALYNDLTPGERDQFTTKLASVGKESPMGYGSEVYDNGNSDGHARALFATIVAPDAAARLPKMYRDTAAIAETNSWMPLGFGLGREWHDGYPSRHGLMFMLMCLQNAGGYTDAETVDLMAPHLRDVWVLTRLATIPHRSNDVAPDPYWTSEKFHTQDTLKAFHRTPNVASHMLWAQAILPGAFSRGSARLDGIAKSEADYFGYLWHVMNEPLGGRSSDRHRNLLNYEQIGLGSGTPNHAKQNTFWSFPAWLIYNAREYAERTPEQAGIPLVRRWGSGTLDWTMVQSSHARSERTSLWYVHRRYGSSGYEEGTRFNGSWSLHRNGPLLMRRSATGHSYVSRRGTFAMNGCVTFIDPTLYPEFGPVAPGMNSDDDDLGGQRAVAGPGDTKAQILANPAMDYGAVTAWHDSGRAVAITSNLTRSYNSSEIRTGKPESRNEQKISSFIREFVRIYNDGTGRGKVFTYDRIRLVDTKFEPRYSICPATDPQIDGTERPHTPWGSQAKWWTTVGPTRWDYSNASRLICKNDVEPEAPIRGDGKVCVTWLRPSGAGAVVRKWGGHNVDHSNGSQADGDPHIGMWNEWHGSSDYASANSPAMRAYVGHSTVTIAPASVTPDTRFLIACEDMSVGDNPGPAAEVPCDPSSVAARCGASVVVFGRDGERASGYVDVPGGVSLVLVVNLSGQPPKTIPVSQPGRVSF